MGILSFFRRQRTREPAREPGRSPEQKSGRGTEEPSRSSPERAAQPTEPKKARPQRVLLSPAITEKAIRLQADNWYAFRIAPRTTKIDIRRAVQEKYAVHVTGVHTQQMPGKVRRRGRTVGHVPGYRRALVSVRAGERIPLEQAVQS